MVEGKEYKYDVAFSFLQQDEALALAINDLIRERLNTFVYSEEQKELAGKDGEEIFNKVFGGEARTVFVLHRKGWGETPWTRIEQTAIRNRAYDEGYDFAIFAPVDESPLPGWVPKTRLWVGLERWGPEGAAAIIEARVQETGGRPREETSEDRARRLQGEIEFIREKKSLLGSESGVKLANEAFANLVAELERAAAASSGEIQVARDRINTCRINGKGYTMLLDWSVSFSNTLESSALYLYLFRGYLAGPEEMSFAKPTRLMVREFQFDFDRSKKPLWKEGSRGSFSTQDLAKLCITILLERICSSI
jgi:hypothetical protein